MRIILAILIILCAVGCIGNPTEHPGSISYTTMGRIVMVDNFQIEIQTIKCEELILAINTDSIAKCILLEDNKTNVIVNYHKSNDGLFLDDVRRK